MSQTIELDNDLPMWTKPSTLWPAWDSPRVFDTLNEALQAVIDLNRQREGSSWRFQPRSEEMSQYRKVHRHVSLEVTRLAREHVALQESLPKHTCESCMKLSPPSAWPIDYNIPPGLDLFTSVWSTIVGKSPASAEVTCSSPCKQHCEASKCGQTYMLPSLHRYSMSITWIIRRPGGRCRGTG